MMQLQALNTLTLTSNEITSAVTSYAPSLRYMRHILPLAIHNIMYYRINFDEELFTDRNVTDWTYKTFKTGAKNPLISYVSQNFYKILSLLDKKVLTSICLLMVTTENGDLLEHYKFKIKYKDARDVPSVDGKSLLSLTKDFFQVISTLSSFRKLSADNIKIVLQIHCSSSKRGTLEKFHLIPSNKYTKLINDAETVTISKIATGHHTLKCQAGGDAISLMLKDDEDKVIIDDSPVDKKRKCSSNLQINEIGVKTEVIDDENKDIIISDVKKKRKLSSNFESSEINEKMNVTDDDYKDMTNTETLTSTKVYVGLRKDEFKECEDVDCFCELKLRMGVTAIVGCELCPRLFHTVCLGYRDADRVPSPFVCPCCCLGEAEAVDLSKENARSLMRIAVAYCVANRRHPPEGLSRFKRVRKFLVKATAMTGLRVASDNTVFIEDRGKCVECMKRLFRDFSNEDETCLEENTLL